MISELHKKTLEALGFEVLERKADYGYNPTYYALIRGKSDIIDAPHCDSEADAWAQAPSLEALVTHLRRTMATVMTLTTDYHPAGYWYIGLGSWRGDDAGSMSVLFEPDLVGQDKDESTAIAALFVAACEAGLIDGKAVVL